MPAEISCTHFSENGQPAGRNRSGESGSRGKVAASSTVTSGGKLAGAPCLLNVVHEERAGKTYANIFSITPLPGAMKKTLPATTTPLTVFDLDAFDAGIFDGLSEYVQKIIVESAEFKSRKPPAAAAPAAAPAADAKTGFDDMDDDIPF